MFSRYEGNSVYMQIYSSRPLPADFKLQADPYRAGQDGKPTEKAVAERQRLVELGVLFYRDSHHGAGCIYAESSTVISGWYTQGSVASDGTVTYQTRNWKVRISWITRDAVKRELLVQHDHDENGNLG